MEVHGSSRKISEVPRGVGRGWDEEDISTPRVPLIPHH
jgi:hypothetical protein